MYSSTMGVMALHIPGHSIHPVGLGILLVIVLLAALAAAAYFFGRKYVNGRHGPGREQSLRDGIMLGLTILGVVALVGLYWK
jgi:membrane protein implicated in regulation of membrane protease activity